MTAPAEREVVVEGIMNLRDLGGLPTTDGHVVRRGLVHRSGHLGSLVAEQGPDGGGGRRATPPDPRSLRAAGIRTVYDLRTEAEVTRSPDQVPEGTEVLAGLELGGVPVVTALARVTGLPATFVRKKAKEYGTARFAEGAAVEGRRVLVVEDVVTSGGQVVLSTADLRGAGADVTDVVCVIDRSEGGSEALAAEGLRLHSVVERSDLDAAGTSGS